MDSDPFLHARRVLEGTADVEAGFIHSAGVGDSEKESALSVVEVLDEALNSPLCPPDLRKECLVALPTLCATYGMLPSRCLPAGHLIVNHQSTICVGGADVRSGALDGLMVTVRTIPYTSGGYISQEDACREIITWMNLKNPNIHALLGVDKSVSRVSTISASMEYGSLREYLTSFPNAPRSKLMSDAAMGLEYMHNSDCIHGDLKAYNVLVNGNHVAVLTNFQSASFLPGSGVDAGISISGCDLRSVRWSAPELLFPKEFGLESARRTKETDIYAFAMVMYEAFSGSFPFKGIRDEASILHIRSGDRPRRPKNGLELGLTDELWGMMEECWGGRDGRWTISRIVSTLKCHSTSSAATVPERC